MDTAIILRYIAVKTAAGALSMKTIQSAIQIKSCKIAKDELNFSLASDQFKTIDSRQERVTIRLGASGKVVRSAEDIFFNIPVGNVRMRTHSRCFFQIILK